MKIGNGERRDRGRERIRRWVRVHVRRTQTRDLFYPICPAVVGPVAHPSVVLDSPRTVPDVVWLNGREVALIEPRREGTRVHAAVSDPAAVVPGENVLSLPVDCDPARVALECGADDGARGAYGWGSQDSGRVLAQDENLSAAATFLLRSLSRDIFGDGAISITAVDPGTAHGRLWSWYWTTAATYDALARLAAAGLVACDLSELEAGFLARQVLDGEQTRGSYFVRWDPDRTRPAGVIEWFAPNDAAYLGLHGLLPASARTGDAVWSERIAMLADWIVGPGMRDGRLRVGWNGADARWDDSWHYIDAAWTPAFLLAASAHLGREDLAAAAEACADDTVARFARPGPFLRKIWRADGRHTETVFARGMGWVLEGWLPLLETGRAGRLRARTGALLEGLLEAQDPDGFWPYLLDRPESGACNKGTPVLACHLNRAKRVFPELGDRLEEGVVKALAWCEARMDHDPASPTRGGIVHDNSEGAITTVRAIPTAFNYGTAYYVFTRLERTP